jgi:hypothetical protein
MPGVEAVLRALKPETVAEQGDTPGAQLRRRRREGGHRRIDAARLDPKSLLWWERDAREPRYPRTKALVAQFRQYRVLSVDLAKNVRFRARS